MEDQEKPQKVLAVCPVCKTKIRENDKIVTSMHLIVIAGNPQPQAELPMVVCRRCGIKFFSPEILRIINDNAEKLSGTIILPGKGGGVIPPLRGNA